MSDYLTPEQRHDVSCWDCETNQCDCAMRLHASHAAADALLREAREIIFCIDIDASGYFQVDPAPNGMCTCPACTVARKIDQALGGDDE